jgi:hypothetical protein
MAEFKILSQKIPAGLREIMTGFRIGSLQAKALTGLSQIRSRNDSHCVAMFGSK